MAIGELEFVMEVPAVFKDEKPSVDLDDLQPFTQAIVRWLAAHGARSPESFKFLRAQSGLSSRALADLFAVEPETISRWASGQNRLNPVVWDALAQIAVERIEGRTDTFERLRDQREFDAQTVELKAS